MTPMWQQVVHLTELPDSITEPWNPSPCDPDDPYITLLVDRLGERIHVNGRPTMHVLGDLRMDGSDIIASCIPVRAL